ncbi:MAG: hypothetical protein Q8T08_25755 [Ignavibacteria bacterium]|jgi:hypothetical protein|nr:hypothetical protein [Ignavibacteria bacterium]
MTIKNKLIIILLIPFIQIYSQWDISASMGLDFRNSPSYRDYVNSTFQSEAASSFKSAISFSGEIDYSFSNNFQVGIELNNVIDSQTSPSGSGGLYEISFTHFKPSILSYYVIPGEGYQFKFGGGLGYRSVSFSERFFSQADYSANGLGVVLKAIGNTALSKDFFALIGIDIRYDFPGELSNNGNKILNPVTNEFVNMNSISVAINLGVTFKL